MTGVEKKKRHILVLCVIWELCYTEIEIQFRLRYAYWDVKKILRKLIINIKY